MHITFRKTSLVDYPGCVASVLFFPGCNLRCPWCHNPGLAMKRVRTPPTPPEGGNYMLSPGGDNMLSPEEGKDGEPGNAVVSLDEALRHLERRRAVLGGVVLSGGEPTIHANLPSVITAIKELGLAVKLDTNGMHPEALEKILSTSAPDYIALDLKLAPSRYASLFPPSSPAAATSADSLVRSATLVHESGLAHEFRTLALPFITKADLDALAPLTDSAPWIFRPFHPGNCLDPVWNNFPPSEQLTLESLVDHAKHLGKNAQIYP